MKKIDYNQLSDEEKLKLREQMEAEDRAAKLKDQKLREDYYQLKKQLIAPTFLKLQETSVDLKELKDKVFDEFKALLDLKQEVYGLSDEQMEEQQSHTFTDEERKVTIIIGANTVDRWSDDVNVGIDRVNKWLENKIDSIEDEKVKQMIGWIRTLLKPNKDGALKANRILDLSAKANEYGDKELIAAVEFIQSQYKPEKTSTYIKAKYLDDNKQWQWLALSMSAV